MKLKNKKCVALKDEWAMYNSSGVLSMCGVFFQKNTRSTFRSPFKHIKTKNQHRIPWKVLRAPLYVLGARTLRGTGFHFRFRQEDELSSGLCITRVYPSRYLLVRLITRTRIHQTPNGVGRPHRILRGWGGPASVPPTRKRGWAGPTSIPPRTPHKNVGGAVPPRSHLGPTHTTT